MTNEEIVDKLPKTKDGVPITPGMKLWQASYSPVTTDDWPPTRKGVSAHYGKAEIDVPCFYDPPTELYSTEEAAIAAKEKE